MASGIGRRAALLVSFACLGAPLGAAAGEPSASATIAAWLAGIGGVQRISTYSHRPPRDANPGEPELGAYCRLVVGEGDDEQDCTGVAILDRSEVLTAAHCFFDDASNAFLPSPYRCTFNSGKPDAVEAHCRLVKLGTDRPYELAQSPRDYAIMLCDPGAPAPPLALAEVPEPADLVGETVSLAGYSSDMNDEGLRISEDRACRIAHYMDGYYTTDCGGWDGASGAAITLDRNRRLVIGTILGAPSGVKHDIPFEQSSMDANIAVPVVRFRADAIGVKRDLDSGALVP
jgi:hypothetical protein